MNSSHSEPRWRSRCLMRYLVSGFLLAKDSLIKSSHASHPVAVRRPGTADGKRPGLRPLRSGDGRRKPHSKLEAGSERPAKAGDEQYRSPGRGRYGWTKIFHPHAPPQNPFVTFAQNFPGFERLSYSERAEPRQAAAPCPAIG